MTKQTGVKIVQKSAKRLSTIIARILLALVRVFYARGDQLHGYIVSQKWRCMHNLQA